MLILTLFIATALAQFTDDSPYDYYESIDTFAGIVIFVSISIQLLGC
jgi:hypothetical protein